MGTFLAIIGGLVLFFILCFGLFSWFVWKVCINSSDKIYAKFVTKLNKLRQEGKNLRQ